jgi:hypothetical protein
MSLFLPRLGFYLQKYKSGSLPKLFKIIPSLPNWARMLALTRPELWSPHASRAATRIFISSMKPPQAQLFLEVVLLDNIREDIKVNKKLNPQYYEALKRALYKPSAFFKGIVFPMLDVNTVLNYVSVTPSHILFVDWMHIERGCDHSFRPGKEEGPSSSFFSSAIAYCQYGLHRYFSFSYY